MYPYLPGDHVTIQRAHLDAIVMAIRDSKDTDHPVTLKQLWTMMLDPAPYAKMVPRYGAAKVVEAMVHSVSLLAALAIMDLADRPVPMPDWIDESL